MNPSKRKLRIAQPGVFSTVQDLGRRDVARFGVSSAGSADWYSARAANRLVGNADNAAVIESTMTGISFALLCDAAIAVTGANAPIELDGRRVDGWRAHAVHAGARISIDAAKRGLRCYVAIDGGIALPLVLGSASTDFGAGFGGLHGRRLETGDVLPLEAANVAERGRAYSREQIPAWAEESTLRVVLGPHRRALSDAAWQTLLSDEYAVSSRSTRQGLQLDGIPLRLERPTDIASAGTIVGCVQVTSAGLPVLLLAEHQTTGGYATVACVISADIPRAAQLRPGDRVRFALVTQVEAAHARRTLEAALTL